MKNIYEDDMDAMGMNYRALVAAAKGQPHSKRHLN